MSDLPVSLLGEHLTCLRHLTSNRLSSQQMLDQPFSPETMWLAKPLGNQGLIPHAFNSQTVGGQKKKQSFCISSYCPCGCLTHPGCVKWPIPSMWLVQVWSVESGQSALLPVFIGLDPDLTGRYLYSLPLLLTGVCICTVSQPWPPECIALSELISNHKLPLFEKPKTTTVLPRRLNRCDHLSVYSLSAPLPVNTWGFFNLIFFLGFAHFCLPAYGDREQPAPLRGKMRVKTR